MFMEAEVVDVIAILDAVIVEDICVAGKTDEIVSFQTSIESTEGGIGP